MSKWIAEFELEDGDRMPEHMDLAYHGVKLDFYCRPIGKSYEDGLNEAWEVARKIVCTPEKGGYTWSALEQIFNTRSLSNIINTYTASEAISKIKEYEREQKKAAEIKIGDEVHAIYDDTPMVVVSIFNEDVTGEKRVASVSISGIISTLYVDELIRTGRHFPEIAEVLKQMQEGEKSEEEGANNEQT